MRASIASDRDDIDWGAEMMKYRISGSRWATQVLFALSSSVFFHAHLAEAGDCAKLPEIEVTSSLPATALSPLADDFETDQLASNWDLRRIALHSHVYSDTFVKHGRQSILLTVHHGDKESPGNPDDRCSERAELSEPPTKWPPIGSDLWYGFSIYLPYDLPPIDRRLVLAQIKQVNVRVGENGIESYQDGNPVLALRLRQLPTSGILCFSVTPGNSDPPTDMKPFALVQLDRKDAVGRWHNIVLHARIVPRSVEERRAEWWFDDQPVPRITTQPFALGYTEVGAGDHSYFKMGPYRDQAHIDLHELDVEWTFGYDEFKRDCSLQIASPTPLNHATPLQTTNDCKLALSIM
jgi:hypothetical protein